MFDIDPRIGISETANEVFPWLIFARRLRHSAYVLDKNSEPRELYKDVHNVARMCIGMAIECYFKAYYVACGNSIHDGKKQKTFGAHNLSTMALNVGFQISDEQKRVLHYLSMWVRVKGRYPVPLKAEDMEIFPEDAAKFPFTKHMLAWDQRSDEVCMELIQEMETQIAAKRYGG